MQYISAYFYDVNTSRISCTVCNVQLSPTLDVIWHVIWVYLLPFFLCVFDEVQFLIISCTMRSRYLEHFFVKMHYLGLRNLSRTEG